MGSCHLGDILIRRGFCAFCCAVNDIDLAGIPAIDIEFNRANAIGQVGYGNSAGRLFVGSQNDAFAVDSIADCAG